jgi:hypothetical protein
MKRSASRSIVVAFLVLGVAAIASCNSSSPRPSAKTERPPSQATGKTNSERLLASIQGDLSHRGLLCRPTRVELHPIAIPGGREHVTCLLRGDQSFGGVGVVDFESSQAARAWAVDLKNTSCSGPASIGVQIVELNGNMAIAAIVRHRGQSMLSPLKQALQGLPTFNPLQCGAIART